MDTNIKTVLLSDDLSKNKICDKTIHSYKKFLSRSNKSNKKLYIKKKN